MRRSLHFIGEHVDLYRLVKYEFIEGSSYLAKSKNKKWKLLSPDDSLPNIDLLLNVHILSLARLILLLNFFSFSHSFLSLLQNIIY